MPKRIASIADLTPDSANANRGTERGRGMLEASLRKYGAGRSVLADKHGTLIAGNKTVESAAEIGLPVREVHTDGSELVVVVRDDLDLGRDKAARELAYADNRVSQVSLEWELAQIGADVEAGVDLAGMFTDDELAALLGGLDSGTEGLTDPDAVPAVPDAPTTQPGDLWLLGRHRLLCGDSTYAEQVARALDGATVDMVFTDPPYGVNVSGKGGDAIAGDISFTAIPLMFAALDPILARGAWVYICGGQSNMALYSRLFEHHYRQLPRLIVWDKGRTAVLRHQAYHSCYELIYYAFREGGGNNWYSERTSDHADDIWRVAVDADMFRDHPTQKPVELPARAIRNSCPPEGVVFEPFGGSGSTLIAAEQTGRRCVAIEMAPKYCDVIVRRWEQFTGQEARRA